MIYQKRAAATRQRHGGSNRHRQCEWRSG